MERSEIRDSRDPGPGLRGAYHRAALRADPLASSGLQPLTTRPAQVICPSGGWLTGLSSLFFRIFRKLLVPTHPKSDLELFASHPTEGRIAIVTDAGRDAVDAAAFCARWDCRAGWRKACERSPSERTRDVAAYGEVVWS